MTSEASRVPMFNDDVLQAPRRRGRPPANLITPVTMATTRLSLSTLHSKLLCCVVLSVSDKGSCIIVGFSFPPVNY